MSLALTNLRPIIETESVTSVAVPAQSDIVSFEPRERATWRVIRLSAAIPLFVLSSAALLPYAAIPVSTQAVVNARLTPVRATKEGSLQNVSLETGDLISATQPLVKIQSSPLQVLDGADYERSMSELEEKRAEVEGHLKANELKLSRSKQETQSYVEHKASDLETELQAAQTQVSSSEEKSAQLQKELNRDLQAEHEHLMPHAMVAQANEAYERAQSKADENKNTVEQLEKKIADLRVGYFGGAQAPTSLDKSSQASDDSFVLPMQPPSMSTFGLIAAMGLSFQLATRSWCICLDWVRQFLGT
jgi:multidrug efflux pump subunit AcrA (membrane-fusion protein)